MLALAAALAGPMVAALLVTASPAAAQMGSVRDPAYAEFANAQEATFRDEVLRKYVASARKSLESDPEQLALEKQSPGYLDEVQAVVIRVVQRKVDRLYPSYRPDLLVILSRHLTPEEARRLTALSDEKVGEPPNIDNVWWLQQNVQKINAMYLEIDDLHTRLLSEPNTPEEYAEAERGQLEISSRRFSGQ